MDTAVRRFGFCRHDVAGKSIKRTGLPKISPHREVIRNLSFSTLQKTLNIRLMTPDQNG